MIGRLIGLSFGVLWLLVGAAALLRLDGGLAAAVAAAGLLAFAIAAWRVVRRRQKNRRFVRSIYIAAVAAEVAALWIAQRWLSAHGRQDLLFPVVGVIVGLHFIGLWAATGANRFLWLTGAMLAINAAAIAAPLGPAARQMVAGFGSSLALLVTASS